MEHILEARNLVKKFGDFNAVNGVSFELREGEILGFLGPNGAGKTTTIQMLLGVLTPTSGDIFYFGKNLKNHSSEILEDVSFSSTYTNLPWDLTVKECLTYSAYFYNIKNRKARVEEIVAIFRLQEIFNMRISELSAGQTTRVNLAKAFLNFPKVLLLDEPTASLDPEVAAFIRRFLLEERKKFKVSMVFTSHNMAEVEEICDRVIFVNHGRIVANDTPENLASRAGVTTIQILPINNTESIVNFARQQNLSAEVIGKYVCVQIKENFVPKFLHGLSRQDLHYAEISIEKPSLEDYFLQAAKERSQDAV